MKLNTLLPIVLAALSAVPASAQIVSMSVPVNPIYGLPKSLPSPLSGPLTGMGISLPTRIGVMPTISFAGAMAAPVATPAAPLIAIAARPVAYAPQRLADLPGVQVVATRENRANPFRALLPDGVARFDGAAPAPSAKGSQSEQDRLDQIFDGEGQPAERPTVELPRRAPVKPSRRHSLPEWDLENELGLSSH
jgi:hypothetical protein